MIMKRIKMKYVSIKYSLFYTLYRNFLSNAFKWRISTVVKETRSLAVAKEQRGERL